jgi:hypothetical protein
MINLMINFLTIVLFFIASLLGPSIRECGWGGKALGTLLVVGESRKVWESKNAPLVWRHSQRRC